MRAVGALACCSIVTRETAAETGGSITHTFIRALSKRVEIVSIAYSPNPCHIIWAGAKGAVCTSPLGVAIKSSVAVAIDVLDASTMA